MMTNMMYFATDDEKEKLGSREKTIGTESYSTYAHKTAEKLHFHLTTYFQEQYDACREPISVPKQVCSRQGNSHRTKMINSNVYTYITALKKAGEEHILDETVAKAHREKNNRKKRNKKET